jgi:hypothetical protein
LFFYPRMCDASQMILFCCDNFENRAFLIEPLAGFARPTLRDGH